MTFRTTLRAARGAFLLAATAALAAPASAQDVERFTLSGDRIQIWNLVGRTVVEQTGGDVVIVEVTRGGPDRRDLRIRNEGGQLAVLYPDRDIVYRDARPYGGSYETRLRVDRDGRFDDEVGSFLVRIRNSGGGLDAHADLRILIPRGRRVEVNIAVGTIDATNTEGDLSLRTRFMPIVAVGHKGPLNARTGSGGIRVERAEGEVRASTGSGRIELNDIKGELLRVSTGSGTIEGRRIEVARFDASTGSGGIRMDAATASDIRTTTGSGSTRLDLRNTPRDITTRAGSGSVEISLPADANVEVDVTTGSGGITSEFPVTMESIRRRELRGRIGTGADGFLRASTGSGSVRILRR